MQKLCISNEKRTEPFSGSAQVYGGASPKKATEIGHLANGTCTFGSFVAASFTASPERTCISGAV